MDKKVVIIGAGNMGTALAQLISNNYSNVIIIPRRQEIADEIQTTHINSEYYPNLRLSNNITSTLTLPCDDLVEIIFLCVPSAEVINTTKWLKRNCFNSNSIIVSTAKGIDYPSLKTMSCLIKDELEQDPVVLSGPTFASEILLNLPTIINIASKDKEKNKKVINALTTDKVYVFELNDIIGIEMCGIIKNIIAIAYGICDGIGINENAKYALLTKGFYETKAIVKAIGGNPSTVNQYCGIGDILLTSTSRISRNYVLGMIYGKRIMINEYSSGVLFEGRKSTMALKEICDKYDVKSVIVDFVYQVLFKNKPPLKAFMTAWKEMKV